MRIRLRTGSALVLLGAVVLLAALAGCQGGISSSAPPLADETTPAQPYAGLQARDIRALAPERVADLLAGRGAGYALAAELNHYPGPTHVLELLAPLELTEQQQGAVSSVKAAMQQDAARLGAQLVDLEEELDRGFRSDTISPKELESLTSRIADTEGELRNIHLQAHLKVKDALTPEQVQSYDALRGYGVALPDGGTGHGSGHVTH